MLKDFRERLQNLMPNEYMRPFACKGNPYECRIFIVGTNPATKMEKPFLANYWSDCTGFLYEKFYCDYDAQKGRKGGARTKLKYFVDGASPIPCLETNIYATPSKRRERLSKDEKTPAIFEFLLREIQPDAIFLYRAPAIDYFEKLFNCKIDSDRYVIADVFEHETYVSCARVRGCGRSLGPGFESISHCEVCASGKQCHNILTPTE